MHGGNSIDMGKVENCWGLLFDNDSDDYTIAL